MTEEAQALQERVRLLEGLIGGSINTPNSTAWSVAIRAEARRIREREQITAEWAGSSRSLVLLHSGGRDYVARVEAANNNGGA